jgi:hypothetical protein
LTAPLDRVKLLLQTKGGLETGAVLAASRGGNVLQALLAIGREGGMGAYWRGNLPQVGNGPLDNQAYPKKYSGSLLGFGSKEGDVAYSGEGWKSG